MCQTQQHRSSRAKSIMASLVQLKFGQPGFESCDATSDKTIEHVGLYSVIPSIRYM